MQTPHLTSPVHGDRGSQSGATPAWSPPLPTLAVSRETGARGSTIARRVGKRLGWEVYTAELLEFLASDPAAMASLRDGLDAPAAEWVDRSLSGWDARGVTAPEELGELPRAVAMLAARGGAVIVGRGAGFLLPAASTLHVRVVAPHADRVAYMAQWLRLSEAAAVVEVARRDDRRSAFLANVGYKPGAREAFDVVVNSSRLGEDGCAELIRTALHLKRTRTGPAERAAGPEPV